MSLRTASDYVYTDVSAIEISGDYLPTRQDNIIRGEDIALIREFAADTEAVMGYGNPFGGMDRIHKIVDLSYIRTRWWDVQKARQNIFPVSIEPSRYESGWTKVCDGFNRDSCNSILDGLIVENRIRTGMLTTPTANNALVKSSISNLVTSTVVTNPYNNYIARILEISGTIEHDITIKYGSYEQTRHVAYQPYDAQVFPWGESDSIIYTKITQSDDPFEYTVTPGNISITPSLFPSSVGRSQPLSMTCDLILLAGKGVGTAAEPSATNASMFCFRDVCVAGQPFANVSSIPYHSILSQISRPSGAGDEYHEVVLICGIRNPVVRWNLNASP